jgi:SOS-response transcriptional repressor LexA
MSGDKKQPHNTNGNGVTEEEPKTLGQRIKWARKRLGLSQRMLALEVGLTQVAVSSIEDDKVKTSSLVKIARALKCSADWLESGIGHITETTAPIYRVPVIAWGQVAKWKEHIKKPLETILMYNFEAPYWFSTPLPNNLMKSSDPSQSFEEGEMVLIDPRVEPKNGSFVFAVKKKDKDSDEGEPIFKKLVADGTRKYLISFQAGIPPIEVDDTVEIHGVAVGKTKTTIFVNYDELGPLDKK